MKSKVKKYDVWTVSNLFDELEDAVYDWDEGWIDNVMDANYSQAHGNVEDACKYLEDMYDECRVPRIATLCERIFEILGHSEYCASTKKSKMKKDFDPSLNTMYEVQHTDYDVPNYAISPNVGDVFINPNGVELKITNISLTSDGTPQIAYNNSSKGYEECYDLDRFRNILHAGYFVKKSTKKSYTPNYQDFRSMVKSIKNTGNHNNVFKE